MKMKVDGGETMAVGTFKFEEKYSPQLYHIFPAASAPARNKDETFEQMAYWTEWYSNDNDQDANEYESLGTIQRNNPKVFYRIVVNSLNSKNLEISKFLLYWETRLKIKVLISGTPPNIPFLVTLICVD